MNWEEFIKDCYYLSRDGIQNLQSESFDLKIVDILRNVEDHNKERALCIMENMISHKEEYWEADKKYKPILIYKSEDICYRVLNEFADIIGDCLKKIGYEVIYFDVRENSLDSLINYADKNYKAVIGVQTYLFSIRTKNGELLHNRFGGPKFNLLLDHPCVMTNHILNAPDNMIVLTHDRNYKAYIDDYFSEYVRSELLAPGGRVVKTCAEHKSKSMDLSFVGSYRNYRDWFASAKESNKKYNGKVRRLIHYMKENPNDTYENAVKHIFKNIERKDMIKIMYECQSSYYIVMNYYREKIIKTILNAGIELNVYGNTWNDLKKYDYKTMIIHDEVYGEDISHIYQKSWMSLNIMSWHKDGMTERIADMMLAGTMVISDKSTYLSENFIDGKDLILFDLNNIELLPEIINKMIADKKLIKNISNSGRKKAELKHTWKKRVEKLDKIISKYEKNSIQSKNVYFEDEVRSGFYVPGMVKRSWAAQIDTLLEVDRICKKYDIQYFAEWGTLLGVVRHKGIIPWDDDMDITMKRPDYRKFIEVASQEFGTGYRLLNAYNDQGYRDPMTRVVNTDKICLDDDFLGKHHQFPYAAGIDIFPMDYISRNDEEDSLQAQLVSIVSSFADAYKDDDIEWGEGTTYVEQIEQMCGVNFDKTKPIQQQLSILLDRLNSLYTYEDADFITLMPIWQNGHTYKFPKEYYDDAIYMPFEDIMVPVPKYYDAILKKKYGDYMRLVKNGSSHDYPFYKEQEKQLNEMLGYVYKEYNYPHNIELSRKEKETNLSSGKTILFIPYQAKNWDTLEPFWRRSVSDKNNTVIVASVPYYHCGFKGEQLDYCDDIDKFPKELGVISITSLNLGQMHPDEIYFQNACDEYGKCVIIHSDYFTSVLYQYTDKLVYVPWFETDDFSETDERSYANMDCYCTMPGTVYADKIFVQSECMRNTWISKLTEWAGEETREIWEQKLVVNDLKKQFKTRADIDLPEQWQKRLGTESGKKIIVYGISAGSIEEYKGRMLDKMESNLSIFEENKDKISVILYQDEYVKDICMSINEKIWNRYLKILDMNSDDEWLVYCDGGKMPISKDDMVIVADAYYGDTSELAHMFTAHKKPVMIQNVSIL